ncbi:MAG: MFS transporter [Actinomycetota bacterium]
MADEPLTPSPTLPGDAGAPRVPAAEGRRGLLRIRDFRLILGAFGVSTFGDDLALVALTIKVADLTGSGLAVSGLLLAGLLPTILMAPVAGLVVDRREGVRVLVVANLVQAGVAVGLAWAETYPLIVTLTFLLSTAAAFDRPALFALIPRTVGEDRTQPANAYLELSRYVGGALGPVAAGALAAGVGLRVALLVDAATFAVVAVAAGFLRTRRPPRPGAARARGREAREGVAFVARDRVLRLTFVVLAAAVVFAAIDNVAAVFFARGDLGAGDLGFGLLLTAWVGGMVVGAVVTGRRIPGGRLAIAVLWSTAVGGAAVAVAAGAAVLGVALAMFALGGVANGLQNVAMRTLMHHRVPEALRGRVFAAYAALMSGAQIVALGLGGLLVTWIGARGALLLAGGGGLVAGLAGTLLYHRIPRSARGSVPGPEA